MTHFRIPKKKSTTIDAAITSDRILLCIVGVFYFTDKCYLITHKNPKRKALHFKRPLRTSYASDSATAVTARWCPFSSCTHFPSVVSQILAVVSDDAVTRSDESAENAASHTHI